MELSRLFPWLAGPPPAGGVLERYGPVAGSWDELFAHDGTPHHGVGELVAGINRIGAGSFGAYKTRGEAILQEKGAIFAVKKGAGYQERILPFDPIPRVVRGDEWDRVEAGLVQRVRALNAFLADVYGPQRMMAEGLIPASLVKSCRWYRPDVVGIRPNGGTHVHVAGIDLVRRPGGEFAVLEDNLRVPSGVSYALEGRAILGELFPEISDAVRPRALGDYPRQLRECLLATAPAAEGSPSIAVLTEGRANPAYFEHRFLAERMGAALVEPHDLQEIGGKVYRRAGEGMERVDVIYRRMDDPEFGQGKRVHHLMPAYASGGVTLANSIGNGVADDKAVFAYVPAMIRFYLAEEPLLEQVETYVCADFKDRGHVLRNLASLVVKRVDRAGGIGMMVGPQASRRERETFADHIRRNPRSYIAQPLVELSTCPTWTGRRAEPRRVDLRPYVLTGGDSSWVLPGGLSRVALTRGSYVVNSSRGGGFKDTWIVDGAIPAR